jgi:hypothetical protein
MGVGWTEAAARQRVAAGLASARLRFHIHIHVNVGDPIWSEPTVVSVPGGRRGVGATPSTTFRSASRPYSTT